MDNFEDSAVLEVSSESKTPFSLKTESRDSITDVSNISTSIDGSLVQSLSLESFSFANELDGFDSGLNGKDLQVRVDNPQKHLDSLETYITFRVTTRTSREEFSENEYVVRRRYNDFVWLRQKLIEEFPTHVIPPLPAKHSLLAQLDRYSREFVICRMAMLHRFLNRIVNHPILSSHSTVHVFLTAKPAEFQMHRKNSGSLIGRMTGSLQQFANSYVCHKNEPEFEAVKDYVEVLSEKLSTLEKIGERINKERKDHVAELNNYSPILTSWAGIEPVLRPLLLDIGVAVETVAAAQQKHLISSYQINFSQPLKEYLMYLEAINEALDRRENIQIEYELALEEMNKVKTEKDQLVHSDPTNTTSSFALWKPTSCHDKLEKLSLTIPKLLKTVEGNQDKMEIANENLRADMERWRIEKKNDLKKLLIKMADQHIRYYQECLAAWEKVVPTLKETGNTTSGANKS
ncbi:sorting nexin-30-like [Macrosteles quadrilineatus]|uniref:sorting nexin-30-like n=1 Tax=Macrosteles quadrilineatus TaxID=74068 RepID=UPI0023E0D8EB|nr:sorting nexin-30-like [Macrosteles quadrilineatus]